MRREEREITDKDEMEAILDRAAVCVLGLSQNDVPYVVPLCFGYEDGCLYFHSAGEGRKLDIIEANNNVCFEVHVDRELVTAEDACQWTVRYRSVIGFGRAYLVEGRGYKERALHIIMRHYSDQLWRYPEGAIDRVAVVRVEIDSMTGKQSGY
jgi:nitroimidazol reductase NimA-like FMN-containing flavoprotein (pyridoxamine 5'-phosphate oxidase superfamily)